MKIQISLFVGILAALALVGCTQNPEENIVFTTPKGYPAPIKTDKMSSWQDRLELAIARGMEAEAAAATMSEAMKQDGAKTESAAAQGKPAKRVPSNRAVHSKKVARHAHSAKKRHPASRYNAR